MTLRGVWRTSGTAPWTRTVQGGKKRKRFGDSPIISLWLFLSFSLEMLHFSCCDRTWRLRKLSSKGSSASNSNPEQKQYTLLELQASLAQLERLVCPEKTTHPPPSASSVPVLLAGPNTVISLVDACLMWNRSPQAARKWCPLYSHVSQLTEGWMLTCYWVRV